MSLDNNGTRTHLFPLFHHTHTLYHYWNIIVAYYYCCHLYSSMISTHHTHHIIIGNNLQHLKTISHNLTWVWFIILFYYLAPTTLSFFPTHNFIFTSTIYSLSLSSFFFTHKNNPLNKQINIAYFLPKWPS